MSAVWREYESFLEALESVGPSQLTGCREWTCHFLLAHLAAGGDEMVRTIEAALEDRPTQPPKFGDDREGPFRAMADPELRQRFETTQGRLINVLQDASSRLQSISFAGVAFTPAQLERHAKIELALHRWDLVGDDDKSAELLAAPDFLSHSVEVLGQLLMLRGLSAARPTGPLLVRLHPDGRPDVELEVTDASQTLRLVTPDSSLPGVAGDAASVLLLLWGRLPSPPGRLSSDLAPAQLSALLRTFQGF